MFIVFENVGIVVCDLEVVIFFFIDFGFFVLGRDEVSGEWVLIVVGFDGNYVKIVVLQIFDGCGQIELFEYIYFDVIEMEFIWLNEIGMYCIVFFVDDIDEFLVVVVCYGYYLFCGVVNYQDVYKFIYFCGLSGIVFMFV